VATLTVLKFNTAEGAAQVENVLLELQKQQLIIVQDAAIVTWPAGKKKPKTQQLHHLAGIGALDGAFWGLLFGLLFFVPLFGLAVGAAIGAVSAATIDVGIDDKFIKEVRSKITPGTSALFVLSSAGVTDKVIPAIKETGLQPEVLSTNLSAEDEAKLREAFAHAE
jgi:uncharacterized membrane protein